MKKTNIVIIILIVYFIFCCTFIYCAYMHRVELAFIDVKEKVLESEMLSEKFGSAKKVKFNNFMQWTSKMQDEECVKVIVTTEKSKKYQMCVIVEEDPNTGLQLAKGYIFDDKKYELK